MRIRLMRKRAHTELVSAGQMYAWKLPEENLFETLGQTSPGSKGDADSRPVAVTAGDLVVVGVQTKDVLPGNSYAARN
jgi:hypothetical protein